MVGSVPEAEKELVKENHQPNSEMVIQQLCSQLTEQMLNETKSQLQVLTLLPLILRFLKNLPSTSSGYPLNHQSLL